MTNTLKVNTIYSVIRRFVTITTQAQPLSLRVRMTITVFRLLLIISSNVKVLIAFKGINRLRSDN